MSKENPMVKLILNEIGGFLDADNGTEEKEIIKELKKKVSSLFVGYELKSISSDIYEIKRKKSIKDKKEDFYIKSVTIKNSFGMIKRLFSKKNPEGYKEYLKNIINNKITEIDKISIVSIKNNIKMEYVLKGESILFDYEDIDPKLSGNRGRSHREILLNNNDKLIYSEYGSLKNKNIINMIFDNKELGMNEDIVNSMIDSVLLDKKIDINIEETVLVSTDIDLKNFINDPIKINILDAGTNNIKTTNKKRFSI